MNTLLENKIFTIPHFLSNDECDMYITEIINKQKIVNFTNGSNFKNDKYIDKNLAEYFYLKIENIFGQELVNKINIVKPNNLIMTGMYELKQQFGLHTDTGLYYDKINKQKSRFTLLVYLNDNYEKGETSFYYDDFNHMMDIKPEKGMALIFDINLWHKGNEVFKENKFWIGCEIIGNF